MIPSKFPIFDFNVQHGLRSADDLLGGNIFSALAAFNAFRKGNFIR